MVICSIFKHFHDFKFLCRAHRAELYRSQNVYVPPSNRSPTLSTTGVSSLGAKCLRENRGVVTEVMSCMERLGLCSFAPVVVEPGCTDSQPWRQAEEGLWNAREPGMDQLSTTHELRPDTCFLLMFSNSYVTSLNICRHAVFSLSSLFSSSTLALNSTAHFLHAVAPC